MIEPATHEAKGFLYYYPDEDARWSGLDPYWTVGSLLINRCDGFTELQTEIRGETFDIKINYSKSGFAPRPEDDVESRLYEFDVHLDGEGERKIHYNLSPRFPEMRHHESGDEINVPFDHVDASEGLSIQFQAANLDLDEIPALLPRAIGDAVDDVGEGLHPGYFDAPKGGHINEIERYVRLTRDWNRKLIRSDGILQRLSMLLSSTSGSSGSLKWDNSKEIGYHHQLRYDHNSADEMIPTHRYGKQMKSYLPENPENFDEGDPLYHPKFGCLFRKSLNRESVRWSDRHDLVRELDETLVNTMEWADIPVDGSDSVFVSDWHFAANQLEDEIPIEENPAPRLESKQDHLLMTILQDMTTSDKEIVDEIATDGGRDVRDLSETVGYSTSTIYRALDRLDGLIESREGHIEFSSRKIAEDIRAIIESTQSHLESAVDRCAQLFDVDVNQSSNSAFSRWLAEYGAEFENPDGGQPIVRIDTIMSELKSSSRPYLPDALNQLYYAWNTDGRKRIDIEDILVDVTLADGSHYKTTLRALR